MEDEDDLSEVRPDAVPPEVRAWLASTFTRQIASSRRSGEDKVKFRSVAQAIRAGILVERIYRRMSSSSLLQFPAEVARHLKVTPQSKSLLLCLFVCFSVLLFIENDIGSQIGNGSSVSPCISSVDLVVTLSDCLEPRIVHCEPFRSL